MICLDNSDARHQNNRVHPRWTVASHAWKKYMPLFSSLFALDKKKNSSSMKSQLWSVRKRSAPSLTEIPFLQDESRQDAKPNIYLITSCKAHLQPKFYPPCDLEFASRGKLRNQRITMGNEYEALQERVKPIWSVYP